MGLYVRKILQVIVQICLFAIPSVSHAGDAERFAQLNLTFGSKREYQYDYIPAENALVIRFEKTGTQELESVANYDERLIRRALIKDIGGAGSELKLVLADADVRVTVSDFAEPFRVVIDLYDKNFRDGRDPRTGLPGGQSFEDEKLNAPAQRDPAAPQKAPRMVRPEASAPMEAAPAPVNGQRRLLQPTPEMFRSNEDLNAAMAKVAPGPGKSWSQFPVYVYRLQTGPYKNAKKDSDKTTPKAVSSVEAMADYAGNLFDFGHEGRALVAYQQVLHKAPGIFSQNAVHLWKLAETHLGQGNFLLAEGYYQSLMERHPDNALAKFAAMRSLDIKAIQATQTQKSHVFPNLVAQLETIKTAGNQELATQIAIRRIYWNPRQTQNAVELAKNRHFIPLVEPAHRPQLEQAYRQVENPWTGFLALTLLLASDLNDTKAWQESSSQRLSQYLDQYKGPKVEPLRQQIEERAANVLNKNIQSLVQQNRGIDAVKIYEGLSADVRALLQDPRTYWFLGEAYRGMGQAERSLLAYLHAAKDSPEGADRLKALYWSAVMAGEALDLSRGQTARATELRRTMQQTDGDMGALWGKLNPTEQQRIYAELKPELEATVKAKPLLKTPPRLVLAAYERDLNTEVTPAPSDAKPDQQIQSPSAQTLQVLSGLARRFGELGLKAERERALKLLTKLKPSKMQGADKDVMGQWAHELLSLADEFRQDNNYLESGRIYALVGTENEAWEGRAEALYKGGLLLYRAGRRNEAIEAFKKASEDTNNLMYADLAKARLSQLQP